MGSRKKQQYMALEETKKKWFAVFGTHNSTMRNRLKSKIVYEFFVRRDGPLCFRCKKFVERKDYSIDHSECFWDALDPLESFYDIDKIYLAHNKCNTEAGLEKGRRRKINKRHKRKKWKEVFGEDDNENK